MDKIWLWHKNNILAKMKDSPGNPYREYVEDFRFLLGNQYSQFHDRQVEIGGTSRQDIIDKVQSLEEYYGEVDGFIKNRIRPDKQSNLRSQAKLRPTILEEFCCYLFKDLPEIRDLGLDFYNKGIFAGLGVNEKGTAMVKKKDVDFCIGKEINARLGNIQEKFIIPIVAVECKTYTDKTMFSEAQFTAQSLKNGNPDVRAYVVSESNQIGLDQIPSQTPLDQYYVLREQKDKPIDADIVYDFFCEVRKVVESTNSARAKQTYGKMIIR